MKSEQLLPQLSEAQKRALDELTAAPQDVALLWGVPSSGKSEVCFHAMAEALGRGQDVLMMLPEISLSTQFIGRVKKVFGENVILYHSGLTDKRRADACLQLLGGSGRLIVGTRSAIFLPFNDLGLVVVDEEQDGSYKQQDPAPRYNARDAAIMLARIHRAKTILASATPSLETWLNATAVVPGKATPKYALVELGERFGATLPPLTTISDTLRAAKRGERRSHFNKELTDRIRTALDRKEQIILFQNRRGVAPYAECTACGWVPRCDHCAIPMTVHRGALKCHYCGAALPIPAACPECGGAPETKGFGTEKIEDELAALYPNARILRLDRDSAGSERAYNNIIGTMERGEADILVGTQMVTKGLDFAGVSLVGVLNADNLVNHPDFRASERAFQLLAQVAGRAGRRGARGEVVVQTAAPGSLLIARAAAGDFRSMAAELLQERHTYGYPPYGRLISIMLRHKNKDVLAAAAKHFSLFTFHSSLSVLGPQQPVTEKIKGDFALMFLLKIPREASAKAVKEELRRVISLPEFRRVIITPNVDPQ